MNGGKRLTPGLAAAAMSVFAVHALNYLYFFVDDEAIPYVYAQNVLHGKGLVYNAIEGRVEGYSDFLHIWIATANLAPLRRWPISSSASLAPSMRWRRCSALSMPAPCRFTPCWRAKAFRRA